MSFSFNTALSGLNANSNALNVVGNNIANANTIGFRSGQITFMDVFASRSGARLNGAGNSLGIGNGVRTGAIHTDFSQGALNESTSPLHAAISGNGFFVVQNSDGTRGYTRAGDFSLNNQGVMVSTTGGQVQGYQAVGGVVAPGSSLSNLKFPLGQIFPPKMTTEATFKFNLDSRLATDKTYSVTSNIYDSLGGEHKMEMTFTKQADGSFLMEATVDGNPAEVDADGAGPSVTPISFTFDSDGQLLTPAETLQIIPDQTELGLAELPSIDINLYELDSAGDPIRSFATAYAANSSSDSTYQDGYKPGNLSGAAIDEDGNIFGVYSNGQSQIIGQLALAVFDSNDGLGHVGGNMFAETTASGQPTIGAANTGTRGAIAGGYLEQSNVNITNEFVELIEAQRGFQANSRVITTANQTFQDLLQMV
ncbi:MAG TPA: flagellar hook protein FlgE [Pyrinomonadaceae bacterium]|nr:flagellar hook protein FlgE [Acidobacteriota bacterium]HQZ95559.1 flagellar hook protein FlgE [Pyrinomonadaceae bacterium]